MSAAALPMFLAAVLLTVWFLARRIDVPKLEVMVGIRDTASGIYDFR